MEELDRGLNWTPARGGGVYLSWRLLPGDPANAGFNVYRAAGPDGTTVKLNPQPITRTTDFIDVSARPGGAYAYTVFPVIGGRETDERARLAVALPPADASSAPSFRAIKLQGDYEARMVTAADLDGDGELEFVIKQPNFNTDPYQKPGYWKRSTDTYKIEAYKLDGRMMWRYDMGWAIEEGTWYSPVLVYDIDGDGRAEVYCKAGEGDPRDANGQVTTGPEWLVKLDGMTGRLLGRTAWPDREGYDDYNRYCRNFLSVAYLDGKRPAIIVVRGTYTLIKILAFDAELKPIWRFESTGEHEAYRGQGAHKVQAADVDNDGRDEIVFGAACLDDNGTPLWNAGLGHPDNMFISQMDPKRPGLQIYYGIEKRRENTAVCLVDARTGEIIWGCPDATKHVHGKGMAGDIDPEHEGVEFHAAEQDGSNYWFYAADGTLLNKDKMGGTSPYCLWWDADQYKELLIDKQLGKYKGGDFGKVAGQVLAVGDFLGDWREEIVTTLKGELRIYATDIPATSRRVCLLKDRQYREGVAAATSGYYFEPQLGRIALAD